MQYLSDVGDEPAALASQLCPVSHVKFFRHVLEGSEGARILEAGQAKVARAAVFKGDSKPDTLCLGPREVVVIIVRAVQRPAGAQLRQNLGRSFPHNGTSGLSLRSTALTLYRRMFEAA